MAPGQAKADRAATLAQMADAEANLVFQVTQGYIDVLRQTEQVRVSEQQRERATFNLRLAVAQLVLCSQSLFRFADLGDDGLCRGGPDKGCGVIVSAIDVVVDRLD